MACCLKDQAITWASVVVSSVGSYVIHLKLIALEILMEVTITMRLK